MTKEAEALAATYAEVDHWKRKYEAAERERDEAQSACTAWQSVFECIEAHLQDRIDMRDPADPATYLSIIRGNVANVRRASEQIVASRWHEAKVNRNRAEAAERRLSEAETRTEKALDEEARNDAMDAAYKFVFPKLSDMQKEKGAVGVWVDAFRTAWDAAARARALAPKPKVEERV